MKATNESLLLDTAFVLAISTAQRIFAIKIRRTKNQAAISQDYLLGGACFARRRAISLALCANIAVREENFTLACEHIAVPQAQ